MGVAAVMNHGRIEQIGKPAEIYETPRTSFVAAFIGDTNFLEGKVTEAISERFSCAAIPGPGAVMIDNDGFLLEQYREEDEELLTLPEE